MFGPLMEFQVGELDLRMGPIKRSEMELFVRGTGGMHRYQVTRYLGHDICPTIEDEHDWYERIREDSVGRTWGIFVQVGNGKGWQLIGNTSLNALPGKYYRGAVSGCLIFNSDYWGMGIAKHTHRARTMFAFDQMGLVVVRSAVLDANEGSRRALESVGYVPVGIERNSGFADGKWLHQTNFELVNPSYHAWNTWWEGSRPPEEFRAARKRTQATLKWAREHVTLM